MSVKPVIIVDGSSYLFRAFHALPPLKNRFQEPSGAIYGVLNMLREYTQNKEQHYLIVVMDSSGKNFRHDWYPEYKATRGTMAEELAWQIEPLKEIIKALGLPFICKPGVEADDVIGSLAKSAVAQGHPVQIVTQDKDFAQLVSDQIVLVNNMQHTVMDIAGVITKFGVKPAQIVDWLALVGDTSDNIPGVEKVGPKTATKWLEQYQTIDNLLEHQAEITGKVGEYFRESVERVRLNQKLVTIVTDLPDCTFDPAVFVPQPQNVPVLQEWFTRLEFKKFLKDLPTPDGIAVPSIAVVPHVYHLVDTPEALTTLITTLLQQSQFTVDTETTGLDTLTAQLVGVSFAFKPNEAFYVPVASFDSGFLKEQLRIVLEHPQIVKTGHNLKFDWKVLKTYGIHVQGPFKDSMLASYVYNSTLGRHDLTSCAERVLNRNLIDFTDLVAKNETFASVPLDRAVEYAGQDADVSAQLSAWYDAAFEQSPGQKKIYETLEVPLFPVLAQMEYTGILVDVPKLEHLGVVFEQELGTLCETAYSLAGEVFNLNSPKQLQEIFYNKLAYPILEKTPTGQPSTAESVLQLLAEQFELPKILLRHRTLSKLKGTYVDGLCAAVSPLTGRLHTSYHQAVTSTGRLSSSDPNLQNIPIRTPEGRQLRAAFIPTEHWVLLSADYSQIELRLMAHFSQDKAMLQAFSEGADIHRFTASEVFAKPLAEVSDLERRFAKTINFGLIYGMSSYGLSKQLETDKAAAQKYIDQYFARYPGVKAYLEGAQQKARDHGFVETLWGRRLYLPDINSKNFLKRQAAERVAINAPLQGTAADLIKQAMLDAHVWTCQHSDKIRMLLQVHDELIFEVAPDFIEEAKKAIPHIMAQAMTLQVPLVVDVGVGANWDAAHP